MVVYDDDDFVAASAGNVDAVAPAVVDDSWAHLY